jgi:hypothetical protein
MPAPLRALVCGVGLWLACVTSCTSPGDLCSTDGDCRSGLVCARPVVDGGPAAAGVCTHAASGPGGFCRESGDCAAGLQCSNELSSPVKLRDGQCVPVPPDDGGTQD